MQNTARTADLPTVPEPPAGWYRGTDRSEAVSVVLDAAAATARLHLSPGWRGHVGLPELESGIVEAFDNAAIRRLIAWSTVPERSLLGGHQSPTTDCPSEAASTTTSPTMPKPAGHPRPGPTPRPDELAASVLRAQRRLTDSARHCNGSAEAPAVVSSPCGRVRMTVCTGKLVAVDLEAAWAGAADDTTLTQAVDSGLRAALRALATPDHPTRDVATDLDDALARALAAHRVPARPGRPPPSVARADLWPDQMMQVLTYLDADETPWRTAADHLRRAADVINCQRPPVSAFSFAGAATARAYDAVQRRTVALLRERAQAFDEAATTSDAVASRTGTDGPHCSTRDDDERPTADPRRAGMPDGTPDATATVGVRELSECARDGLNTSARHLQVVVARIDALLSRLTHPSIGPAVVVHEDISAVQGRFDRAVDELSGVLASVGDPDVLREVARTWSHQIDERVSTLTGMATPVVGAVPDHRPGGTADAAVDLLRAQADAAAAVRRVGADVHAGLMDLADAVQIFWAAITAAISATEAILAIAAALADSPVAAPDALALATTATLELVGLRTFTVLALVIVESDTADRISALVRRLVPDIASHAGE